MHTGHLLLLSVSLSYAFASPSTPQFHPRNYVSSTQLLPSYDYIIAGGGLAGLVLAAGLSDADNGSGGKYKVLVLEAGLSGDDVRAKIDTPGATYYQSISNAEPYDWMYKTVSQPNANNREIVQPRGKVLGGSSAVNGLYLVRPPKEQIEAWNSLSSKSSSSPWAWDSFFKSMIATETFTPPTSNAQSATDNGIKYKTDSRGTSGKLHVSYPGYMPPISNAWLPTLAALGIPSTEDAYGGNNLGAFFATSAINPSNWTRSYAKSAFIDPLPPRDNLHILTGAMVERVEWADNVQNGDVFASGVSFSLGRGQPTQFVATDKEVILAGGAFGSPHILQHSGVGPKDVLAAVGVNVKVDLPGVGQHFVDHIATGVFYKTVEGVQTAGSIQQGALGSDLPQSREFLSFVNDAIAYVNGSLLFGSEASFAGFRQGIADSLTQSINERVPSQSDEVKAGYKAIYEANLNSIIPSTGIVEMLFSINAPGEVAIQAALQTAFSRGRMYISSPNAYDPPTIDPGYFTHPADLTILRQGIKLARQIASTPPLSSLLSTDSATPDPASTQTDAQIEDYIRSSIGTEYHPGSTCAMLPREQGGVVDGETLKVYGTGNVRVVDAGVFPVSFSAHMMSVTYALAERSVGVVLGEGKPQAGNTTDTGNGTTSGGNDGPTSDDSKGKNAAVGVVLGRGWMGVLLMVAACVLL